jgi:hypothetical protein
MVRLDLLNGHPGTCQRVGTPPTHSVARDAIVAYSGQRETRSARPHRVIGPQHLQVDSLHAPASVSDTLPALLAAHHRQVHRSKGPGASMAHIVAFHLTILEVGEREVQVADTTACRASLAGNHAVLLENTVQRVNQRPNLSARLGPQGRMVAPVVVLGTRETALWRGTLVGIAALLLCFWMSRLLLNGGFFPEAARGARRVAASLGGGTTCVGRYRWIRMRSHARGVGLSALMRAAHIRRKRCVLTLLRSSIPMLGQRRTT